MLGLLVLLLPAGAWAAPALPELVPALEGLRRPEAGYAVLPRGALVSPAEEKAALDFIPVWRAAPGNWVSSRMELLPGSMRPALAEHPGARALGALIGRAESALRAALPEEEIRLEGAGLRLGNWGGGAYVHPDGFYLTLAHALRGAGSILYLLKDAGLELREAAEGEALVMTNADREELLGIPAALHSAPIHQGPDRALVLARWIVPGARRTNPLADRAAADRLEKVHSLMDQARLPVHDDSRELVRILRRL